MLDPARYELRIGEETFALPRKEFEVMSMLMERAGRIVTRDRILDEVIGEPGNSIGAATIADEGDAAAIDIDD